jgi:hypothetical protein
MEQRLRARPPARYRGATVSGAAPLCEGHGRGGSGCAHMDVDDELLVRITNY